MKANELRVGSLFYPINRSGEVHLPIEMAFKVLTIGFKIEAIPYDKIPAQVEKWEEFNTNDLSEITLTKEWLLKFGFIKDDEYDKCYNKILENGFYLCGIGFGVNNEKYDVFLTDSNNNELTIVKYVHQLQNLYFALTGKELELN